MILILPLKPQRLFDFSFSVQYVSPGFVAPAPDHISLRIRQFAWRAQVIALVVIDAVARRRAVGCCLKTLPCRCVLCLDFRLFLRNGDLQFRVLPRGRKAQALSEGISCIS